MNQATAIDITIDIVSDVVCPWCFIGKAASGGGAGAVRAAGCAALATVFLNPDTHRPRRALPAVPGKVWRPGALAAIWASVREAGQRAGIGFEFEKIALRANTLAAHRLIHRFQQQGGATEALVEAIFAAGFCAGRFIGDPVVLADLAAQCGEDRAEVLAWLQSDAEAEAVQAQEARIRQMGIGSVPFFIFNGKLAVSGAQPPEVLLDALRQSIA
ncbi:MAG: DsbA family oxidoreductase [Betaproteobacteria bacterium]|nr:DsbA family oxidoreductase [Betaproteobacteria bacterium]